MKLTVEKSGYGSTEKKNVVGDWDFMAKGMAFTCILM